MMYEDLIKALRDCANDSCEHCAYLKQGENCFVKFCGILQDAADAIEVLSKKEKTTHWIPVTERLPRMWEEVMLRFPNNQAVGFHDGDSGWAVFSGDNMYTYVAPEEVHPTHWKPKEE